MSYSEPCYHLQPVLVALIQELILQVERLKSPQTDGLPQLKQTCQKAIELIEGFNPSLEKDHPVFSIKGKSLDLLANVLAVIALSSHTGKELSRWDVLEMNARAYTAVDTFVKFVFYQ